MVSMRIIKGKQLRCWESEGSEMIEAYRGGGGGGVVVREVKKSG